MTGHTRSYGLTYCNMHLKVDKPAGDYLAACVQPVCVKLKLNCTVVIHFSNPAVNVLSSLQFVNFW